MKSSEKYNKSLNILYTHRTRGRDVEGVHIKGMTNAFKDLGHKVKIVSVPGTKVEIGENFRSRRSENLSIWGLVSKYCPQLIFELLELLYNILLYVNLLRQTKNQQIDFIYERYALNTFASVLYGKTHKIPVILEINDATGIQRVRRHKAEFVAKRIESLVFNNASALVTISSKFQNILEQRIEKKEKVSYRPNAIDPAYFNPDIYDDEVRVKLGREKIIIGFIGSFAFWHGIEMLAEVMQDIINEINDVHFLLVGSGEGFNDFNKRVINHGLKQYVTFTGKVKSDKVALYLKAMDIGLIPNSNEYGSPVKLFEYMAMGVVPVAPKLKPILDVIEDGKTGFIFERNDSKSFIDRIIYLCKNSEIRRQVSKNARKKVLKNHQWSHNAGHVLNVYNQILEWQKGKQ